MNRLYKIQLLFIILIVSANLTFGQYFDNFEFYFPNQKLACQNPDDWTTWNYLPCSDEDAILSSNYARNGNYSLVILRNNDLVKLLGDKTYGYWRIDFWVYIPTNKDGYFTILNTFPASQSGHCGLEVYFDIAGAGRLLNGSSNYFSWQENTWQNCSILFNLDSDNVKFWFNNILIDDWQWTRGNPGTYALRLAAMDFYGPLQTNADECYYDDFIIWDGCMSCTPPNEPSNLTAQQIFQGKEKVELNWQDNSFDEDKFYIIRRNGLPSDPGIFQYIGSVTENTTLYIDSLVQVDSTYSYGIVAHSGYGNSGTSNFASITIEFTTIIDDINMPEYLLLEQNHPNPFNPSTNIKYTVPEAGNVKIAVYNLVGEEVAVLVDGFTQAGTFEVTFDASNLSSGVYLYQLQSSNSVQTKKMMFLK